MKTLYYILKLTIAEIMGKLDNGKENIFYE